MGLQPAGGCRLHEPLLQSGQNNKLNVFLACQYILDDSGSCDEDDLPYTRLYAVASLLSDTDESSRRREDNLGGQFTSIVIHN